MYYTKLYIKLFFEDLTSIWGTVYLNLIFLHEITRPP